MFNALPLVSVRLILTLVLVFVLFSRKILVTKSEFAFLLLSVAYCTAEWLYNPAYNKNFINDLIFFMFCFSFYIIQKDMQNLKVKVIKVWVGIVSLASISSVLSCVLYAFLPSTFFPAGYDGYATVINPLGFIHLETGGFRPSWFFAEPSYLGFYLGANLLFVYRYYKTRLPKSAFKLFMMIYLLSCFTVQSGTIVVSLAFSFLISIFYKLAFKSTTTLYWLLVALMIVVLIVVLELDLMEIYTSYNLLSSLGDRQSRMISSAEIYQDMSAWEYLWGTHKYNIIYRLAFSLVVYVGATQTLDLVWNLSDIANALMAVPNLVSMLVLAPVIKEEVLRFEAVIAKEKAGKKADLIEKNEETLHI